MNTHRLRIFKIIAILFPFLLIGGIELMLRLCQYGNNPDLFIEYAENKNFLVFNPRASLKYFPDPNFAPVGNQELFKKEKDKHTFRIFILGESTTIGYPYFHSGSFHRWLLYRLMHSYPEVNFELINLSLTAVNSYTVRDFAQKLVQYEPDAVFIYCGQNEYYGALGIGSTQAVAGKNPVIANILFSLRESRIVQLINNIRYKIVLLKKEDIKTKATRMELMVCEQEIPYQSDLYKRGIHQFQTNMEATIKYLQRHSIPVFISNLVSNEKDLPPFIDDGSDFYNQAWQSLLQSDTLTAQACFAQAKEHDKLRFRAPERLNGIIDSLCRIYPYAHLVDTRSMFITHSEDHLLGNNLFTDHVHPNLKGYYLMSNAFYDALKAAALLPTLSGPEMTSAQLYAEMPVSAIDSLAGELRIRNLKGHWPFNDARYKNLTLPSSTPEDQLAARLFRKESGWLDAHNKLYTYYLNTQQPKQAARVAEAAVLEYPEDPAFYEKAAMANGKLGEKGKAIFYLKKSFASAPTFDKAHYLFVLCLMADNPVEALPYLDFAIAHNDREMELELLKMQVDKLIVLKQQLQTTPSDASLIKQITELYQNMGNTEGANKYVQKTKGL